MHFVFVMLWAFAARALCALRGIAAVSHPSVCSPSVTLRYRGHIIKLGYFENNYIRAYTVFAPGRPNVGDLV